MNKLLLNNLFLLLILFVISCSQSAKDSHEDHYVCPMRCEGSKTYEQAGICPVCKMELVKTSDLEVPLLAEGEVSEASIFNLESQWVTQNEDTLQLKDFKGKPFVAVMVYTSCQAACPRLVADMRNIKSAVNQSNVQYVLISIDPDTDTPERLREFAQEEQLDGDQWTLLQGQLDDVREFSNVVSVKYKKISPIDFAHTNIISVFDREGVLQFQQEGLGADYSQLIEEVKGLAK